MLTQRHDRGFPIAVCTVFAGGCAATQTTRSYLQANIQADLGDGEISLLLVFQGAPGRNDGISA